MKKSVSATDRIFQHLERFMWCCCCIVCFVFGAAIGSRAWGVYLVLLVLSILIIRWVDPRLLDPIYNEILGIRGEIKVAAMLARLPTKDFFYINDIVLPGSRENIDHVVIGKNGVWAIETKHVEANRVGGSARNMLKDGKPIINDINQVRRLAKALHTYLEKNGIQISWVQGVLVYSRDKTEITAKERFRYVYVTGFRQVQALIQRSVSNVALSQGQRTQIEALVRACERPED